MAFSSSPMSFNISFFDIKLARKNFNKYAKYVVGYGRLSFDEDGSGYCSILNQKSILEDIYHTQYEDQFSTFVFIEDDNVSGYKFERPGLYRVISLIEQGKCNIILAKDLSRIGRHGALTQLFIEQCERVGIQIIAMDDYNSNKKSDDLILGIRAWSNERVVKDASEKILKIISHKQKNGEWLCAVPYGYIADFQKKTITIDPEAAKVVKLIGKMYITNDWGVNKIAKELMLQEIPTPRMHEQARRIAEGLPVKRQTLAKWNGAHIAAMLDNDFYNGTYRAGKYKRDGINGADIRTDIDDHQVIPNHHEKIWDDHLWEMIRAKRERRKKETFRGTRKNESLFHGVVYCGNCGNKMYHYVNSAQKSVRPAYICSTYFKYGKSKCNRNPIKDHVLIEMTVAVLKRMLDMCPDIIDAVDENIKAMRKTNRVREKTAEDFVAELEKLNTELRYIENQRIKQIIAHPEREYMLNEVYDNMHNETQAQIDKIKEIIEVVKEKEAHANEAVNKITTARGALEAVVQSGKIKRGDVEALFEKIIVYKNGLVDVHLIPDLTCIGIPKLEISDDTKHLKADDKRDFRTEEVEGINVVRNGDPSHTTFITLLAIASSLDRLAKQFVKNRLVQN